MIVGRVLASEAFGIPNVKLSIFIELDENDAENTELLNIYPYETTQTKNKDGVRYNLLPDSSDDECFRVVGTFPNKRLVLDDKTTLEVFDKYWKYTTVTNNAGDYFIPHVPTGNTQIHADFDISDVGILSQRPRDMYYKGYNSTLFDNANQFKESTNLDSLTQIFSQDQSLYVYPFWGEEDLNEIAITRCDINIQYKFEPTCVFMGAIASDNFSNTIGHNCKPFRGSGYNNQLIAGQGTIEMIRKTIDGFVEEYQIQGNQLIDGDGIWCYQIPMNLDYVQTDEYGNIIPTDNPNKGIPTRTSVRFRFSLQESSNEGIARHKAKYLVPNNPKFDTTNPVGQNANGEKIFAPLELSKDYSLDSYYEFGTATNEDSYRDLYWNNVYSVKNYIPRVQVSKKAGTKNFTGLKTANNAGDKNPFPFNKIRFKLSFTYRLSCILALIVAGVISMINITIISAWDWLIGKLCNLSILGVKPFKFLCHLLISCIEFPFLTDSDEGDCAITCFYPGCRAKEAKRATLDKNPECDDIEADINVINNKVQQLLAEENDAVNLDFYNDWLNGTLYMPTWYWKKRRKKKFFFGLFSRKAVNAFCNCDKKNSTRVMWPCRFDYDADFNITTDLNADESRWHDKQYTRYGLNYGIIKEKETLSGLRAYYYSPGVRINPVIQQGQEEDMTYMVLFATDIILLGSLNDCDLNGVPQMFRYLPPTTANIMPVNRDVEKKCGTDEDDDVIQETTGMDFWTDPDDNNEMVTKGNGYFMDIGCNTIVTMPKTCVNAERLSELGVNLDQSFGEEIAAQNNIAERQNYADGMITRVEIADYETRAMFATLNHYNLRKFVLNKNNGYYYYKFKYLYPIEFDGRMTSYATRFTTKLERPTTDNMSLSYLLFRQGEDKFFYGNNGNSYAFPVYNNSYYFYFGITEGKTAIDKFYSLFFSECFQNKKYPFNSTITSTNANWYTKVAGCEDCEEALGNITINLDGISTPYTYSIEDSFGEQILTNVECSNETLVFDKYFDNVETLEDNCLDEVIESGNTLPIVNDTYTITITDSKNHSVSQLVELQAVPISVEYTTLDLNVKFYANETKKSEVCSSGENCYNAGAILIHSVTIDSVSYPITSFAKGGEGTYAEISDLSYYYDFTIGLECGTSTIKLVFTPNEILNYKTEAGAVVEVKNFIDSVCTECVGFVGDNFQIPIWIPTNYTLTVIQEPYDESCGEALNTSTFYFEIRNGRPFDMIVSNVMAKFILGKEYDNCHFINSNGNDGSVRFGAVGNCTFSDGWFHVNDEDYLMFNEDFENLNQTSDYWYEVIGDDATVITDASFQSVAEYKLESLMNLSKSCYVTMDNSYDGGYNISTVGGRKPVLIKSFVPIYDNITGEEGISDFSEYLFDSETVVTQVSTHPTIIGWNYKYYNVGNETWDNIYPRPNFGTNKIFNDDTRIGNYFAAFTNNGGLVEEGGCAEVNPYVAVPPNAKPLVYNDVCIKGEHEDSNFGTILQARYFRTQFIDRRLDYDILIMTPYLGDGLIEIKQNQFDWTKGRISGITINGVEFAYDENYNIVEESANPNLEYGIEYRHDVEGEDYTIPKIHYNTDVRNKRFYEASVKCGNNLIDIRDSFWAIERRPSGGYSDLEDLPDEEDVKGESFFNVDHSGDYQAITNGDFNEENYPTVRLFDVAHIPNGAKMELTITPCDYNIDLTYDDLGRINIITARGDEETFETDNSNIMTIVDSDMANAMASGNDYNVIFDYNEGEALFEAKNIKYQITIRPDNDNEKNVRTRIPYAMIIYDEEDESLNSLKALKKKMTVREIDNLIYLNDDSKRMNLKEAPEGINIEWFDPDSNNWNSNSLMTDTMLASSGYYPYLRLNRDRRPVEDNSTHLEECIFRAEFDFDELNVNKPKFIATVIDREYFNDDAADFLTKKIRVINTSNMFDVRDIKLTVVDAGKETVVDNSTSGSGSGSITIPPTGTDESGNPTGGGTSNVDVEVVNSAITQYVTFRIDWSNEDWNHEFEFYRDMEFGITFSLGGTEEIGDLFFETYAYYPVIPTTVSNTEGQKYLEFKIYWNGQMKNIFLDQSTGVKFFIKTRVGLIYVLKFMIHGEDGNFDRMTSWN